LQERGKSQGALEPSTVLEAFRAQRHCTLRFDAEMVPPLWVKRSEATLDLFCKSLPSPDWGVAKVDLTELFLALTFHGRDLSWPSEEALLASRSVVISSAGEASWPDFLVSEDMFEQLPFWTSLQGDSDMKKWLFEVLLAFTDDSPVESHALTARRLFMYLGMGLTPSDGLRRALHLFLPQDAETFLVSDLHAILFGLGRPAAVTAGPAPDLPSFCLALGLGRPPTPDPDAAPPPPEKKGKGKSAPQAEEVLEEMLPPKNPEEASLDLGEDALLRHPAIVRALCTHGGLLCRRRVLDVIYPDQTLAVCGFHNSDDLLTTNGLASLVPPPVLPVPEEGHGE